jgi:hypothetical protein
MATVTIDLLLAVQCGKSLLVPINGKNVLITASSSAVADPDQGGQGEQGTEDDVDQSRAETPETEDKEDILTLRPSIRWRAPSLIRPARPPHFVHALDPVQVLDVTSLMDLADLNEPAAPSSTKHGSFEISGVASVHLPHGSVDERHLAALSRGRR